MDSKAVLARFEAERQALAVMDHPNIAKVLDGGVTDAGLNTPWRSDDALSDPIRWRDCRADFA